MFRYTDGFTLEDIAVESTKSVVWQAKTAKSGQALEAAAFQRRELVKVEVQTLKAGLGRECSTQEGCWKKPSTY